jgi:hypothetical protein
MTKSNASSTGRAELDRLLCKATRDLELLPRHLWDYYLLALGGRVTRDGARPPQRGHRRAAGENEPQRLGGAGDAGSSSNQNTSRRN